MRLDWLFKFWCILAPPRAANANFRLSISTSTSTSNGTGTSRRTMLHQADQAGRRHSSWIVARVRAPAGTDGVFQRTR